MSVHDIQEICEGNPAHLLFHVGLELHDGGGHAEGAHDHCQLVQRCHVTRPATCITNMKYTALGSQSRTWMFRTEKNV